MKDFLTLQQTKADSENSWTLDVSTLGDDCDLSVKNPHKVEEVDERTPAQVFDSIWKLQEEAEVLKFKINRVLWIEDDDNLFGPAKEDEV